jgi:outer membrane receptor for ferric coprogen and ferric-rhodotorulic acid
MEKHRGLYLSFIAFLALNTNIIAEEVINLEKIEVLETSPIITEGSESYTTKLMNTSTKLDLSIKDTPQHVNVMTTKEFEDKNIDSYDDVLRNTPGVGFINVNTGLTAFSRGFRINSYKIDGAIHYNDIGNFDTIIYDRVEVVRGANGLTTGSGEPSLKMNFVRKHANSKKLTGSITLDAGSWDAYGQTTDITAPLTEDKKTRARIIVKNNTSKDFYANHETKNNIYYGIIDSEINDQISYSLGASYQEQNINGAWDWGLPTFYTDRTKINLPRSTSFAKDWTYNDTTTKDIFGSYKHYLYDEINLNISSSYKNIYSNAHQSKIWHSWNPVVDKDTGAGPSIDQYKGIDRFREKNLDINLDVPFEIANLSQEIIFGASYNKNDHKRTAMWGGEYPANIFNYDGKYVLPGDETYENQDKGTTQQTASYLAGKFSLSEKLKLITGLRISTWKYKNWDATEDNRNFNSILTPYAGLVYDLNKQHSLFLSYTDIFQPQNNKDINEKYLDPIVGKNYETGIKSEFLDGKLNSTISVYRILQDNVAKILNPYVRLPDGKYAYKALEGVVSKGIEFTVSGQITDTLDGTFGISHFKAKDAAGENVSTDQERTSANVFLNYKMNKDFNFGLGARYYSKAYNNAGEWYYTEQKPYTLIDLMASYKVNKNASIQLNIKNLFDKNYYEGVDAFYGMVYGDPRNFNISYKYKF